MPPRLARLLAAVVAVGLVTGAFAIRSTLSEDDDTVTTGGGSGSDDGGPARAYRVACDADLGDACDALAGAAVVETLTWEEVRQAASEGAPAFDAWLTLDPMPAILDQARLVAGHPAVTGPQIDVASSPLALLTRDGGLACDDWSCTTEAADDVGIPPPTTSAGLLVAAGAFAGVAGDEVDRVGIAAFEGDAEERVRDLTDELDLAEQATRFVTQRGRYLGIVTTAGLAARRAELNPTADLRAVDLGPEVVVSVVLAGIGSRGDEAVGDLEGAVTDQTVRDALAGAGWARDPEPGAGLPDPDVIYALWEELGS